MTETTTGVDRELIPESVVMGRNAPTERSECHE
jgi:hypothetical protein